MEQKNGVRVSAPEATGAERPSAPERPRSLREAFLGMRGEELYREWVDAGKPRRATA